MAAASMEHYSVRHSVAGLLILALASLTCRRECETNMARGDWEYRSDRVVTLRGTFCRNRLMFRGRAVLGNDIVITPLGTFKVMTQSEHGDSDSGWKRVNEQTPARIAPRGDLLTESERAAGFYISIDGAKRPGTPSEWVFMGGVSDPGWVDPSKLTDVHFLKLHPARRGP